MHIDAGGGGVTDTLKFPLPVTPQMYSFPTGFHPMNARSPTGTHKQLAAQTFAVHLHSLELFLLYVNPSCNVESSLQDSKRDPTVTSC